MLLNDRCRSQFDERTRTRGLKYFRQRRVTFFDEHPGRLEVDVEGSLGDYRVEIDWTHIPQEKRLFVACNCPHFEGGYFCKHIWATLLEMDQVGMNESIPGSGRLRLERSDAPTAADPIADDLSDLDFDVDSPNSDSPNSDSPNSSSAGLSSTKESATRGNWMVRLAEVHRKTTALVAATKPTRVTSAFANSRLVYLLNVGGTVKGQNLVIDLFQQRCRKDGTYGQLSQATVSVADFDQMPDPADRRLLQLMLGNTGGGDFYYNGAQQLRWLRYTYATPSSAIYDVLLPELCATGRFLWVLDSSGEMEDARPIAWDERRWQFRLSAKEDTDRGVWTFDGEFCHGDERIALSDAVLLTADGLLLLPDRLARFDGAEHFGWIDVLRRSGAIEIPFDERARVLENLWTLPRLPELDLPASLQFDQRSAEPQPRLTIESGGIDQRIPHFHGHVSFRYGERAQIAARQTQAAVFDAEQQCIWVRDWDAEQRWINELFDCGAEHVTLGPSSETEPDVLIPRGRFVGLVDRLTEAGWIVESHGRRLRRAGAFSLSVSSSVDWFELDGQLDFDGVKASLPSLLQAVRSGSRYVKLDDGSQGMLPQDWLDKYGRLAELGAADGDALRFAPSQTLLLDALLADQENVHIDRRFADFRRKLQAFEGVQPCAPPRGFQGELRDYQREGLGWLKFLKSFGLGGCLADDMGLGKTVQVLALLEAARTRRVPKGTSRAPSLVVVPKSLVFNWIEEAARFAPRLRVLNYTGLNRAADFEQLPEYDVVVTTYGTLRRDIVKLKETPFHFAILDEAQAIKNHQSQAAKACRLIQAEHRLALTGTPVENHLGELWSLFEFLNPGMLGRSSVFSTLSRTRGPDTDRDALSLLSRGLRPFLLRRTKEQVLTELPEKTEQTLHCEMPPKQRKLYDELRDYYRTQLDQRVAEVGLEKSKIHVLEALLRLRQAACHPGLLDPSRVRESSAKLESLLEKIDEIISEGHKALIFSQFTSLLAIVRRRLDRRKIRYEYLDGGTTKRAEHVQRFQTDPDCPLFLISLKAGGQGLNLTAADYVFILDPWWNPAVEAQAVDRAHRIGQTRRVFAYRLICQGTVEEKIIELQKNKRELADAIISQDDSLIRNLTAEDLQLLLS